MKQFVVVGLVVVCCALGWSRDGMGEQVSGPRGEVRIVDNHHFNWTWIVLNVFEHLIEFDKDGQLVPRLATGWRWLDDRTLEFTLRRGVTFHNGEVFDAEIVRLNWEENIKLKQPLVLGRFMNFEPGSRLEVVDPYTVRFHFPEPDGGALARFCILHMANRQFHDELGWGEKNW
jgi:ABC-type transport system substrate-binding protein